MVPRDGRARSLQKKFSQEGGEAPLREVRPTHRLPLTSRECTSSEIAEGTMPEAMSIPSHHPHPNQARSACAALLAAERGVEHH